MKKMKFDHYALHYRDPETGEYNEEKFSNEPIEVPFHFEVCGTCHGFGHAERSDIDCSRLVESMIEDGDDESVQDYFSGGYDAICPTCHGQRVVQVPLLPEWARKCIDDWYHEEAADKAYAEMERRMGA